VQQVGVMVGAMRVLRGRDETSGNAQWNMGYKPPAHDLFAAVNAAVRLLQQCWSFTARLA